MLEYGWHQSASASDTSAAFMEMILVQVLCPYVLKRTDFDPIPEELAAKMHKMIAIIQFKVEVRL